MLLITGGSGFIGRHLCRCLISKNIPFVCLARNESNEFFKTNSIRTISSELDLNVMSEAIRDIGVTGIVHLATYFVAEHGSDDIDQLIDVNVKFGCRLLDVAKSCGIPWFLNTGTFWQHYHGDMYNPVNMYAATKQAFEDIAKYYALAHELRFCTLKLCDTYGPDDTRKKIFHLWDRVSKTGEQLEMSPGDQLIDIVHVDTVVAAFLKLIQILNTYGRGHKNMETYYVSSGREISLRQLADEYQKTYGVTLNIKWGAKPYRVREVMRPQCIGERIVVDE